MSTYDDLALGDRFLTQSRVITGSDLATIVQVGGYTHPLFNDPAYLETSPFEATPLPGEGVLLLMGGLVESTEKFDDTVIALTGFTDVSFKRPVSEGDEIHVEVEVMDKEDLKPSVSQMTIKWSVLNSRDEICMIAVGKMLFRRP